MGCASVTALIFGHVVLVLFIASMAGTSWIIGNTTDTSKMINGTCHKGLWHGNCGLPSIIGTGNNTKVEGYFLTAQAGFGLSFLICFVAVIMSYCLLCCKSNKCAACCYGFMTALYGSAVLTCTVALAVVAGNYSTVSTFPADYKYLFLGWTYWVAVATDGMIFLTLILNACSVRENLKNKKRQQYERV